jgi:hypothetical protein
MLDHLGASEFGRHRLGPRLDGGVVRVGAAHGRARHGSEGAYRINRVTGGHEERDCPPPDGVHAEETAGFAGSRWGPRSRSVRWTRRPEDFISTGPERRCRGRPYGLSGA